MDEKDRLYIDITKKEMKATLESGTLKNPMQQYAYIDSVLKNLLMINNPVLNSVAKKYFEDQKAVSAKIELARNEQQKALDEYAQNCKDIYEQIKKL